MKHYTTSFRPMRRQASHTVREFLRGAGQGAIARANRTSPYVKIGGFAALAVAILLPLPITLPLMIVAAGAYAGTAAYCAIHVLAAVGHRVANKGIPEAPSHNRKAQKWGRNTAQALALASAATAFAAVSGGITLNLRADTHRIERQIQRWPSHKKLPPTIETRHNTPRPSAG